MTNSLSCVIPEITVHNDRPVTTSIAVANFFGKLHKDVLKKIRMLDCSPAFTTANFCAVVVTAQAGFDEREIEAFEMTKNGFIFLVMGFTGKRAAAFKEAYIAEFDRMEAELNKRNSQPPAQIMPIFPVNADFDMVTHVRCGIVAAVEMVPNGALFLHPSDAAEMMRRTGYVVIHHKDLGNYPAAQLANLCSKAKAEEARWAALES